jgi:hypothetical protein
MRSFGNKDASSDAGWDERPALALDAGLEVLEVWDAGSDRAAGGDGRVSDLFARLERRCSQLETDSSSVVKSR